MTGYSSHMMPGGFLWRSVKYMPNSFSGGGQTGSVQKVAWDGTVLWNFVYSTTEYSMHHDFCPMPNGNVLLISYEKRTAIEVANAGTNFTGEMWPDKVVEIRPTGLTTGETVWEWKVWNHLVQNTNANKANYQSSIVDHPELLNINYKTSKDWMHMNGIDYNPILDQIVVSSHNMNEWYVIDHSTTTAEAASHKGGNSDKGGDFLYRWGNPAAYSATGTNYLKVTHDAHWIKESSPNSGRIVGFNNQGISNNRSCVDQVIPPLNGYLYNLISGKAYEPSIYTFRHTANGYSSNMGSSQELPNGNILVCLATAGTIYEVNSAGLSLWSKTYSGPIPQAFRYSKCEIENPAPAIPIIVHTQDSLSTQPSASYQWYLNGQVISGAISMSYFPKVSGVYIVRTTDQNGCVFQYSKGIKITIQEEPLIIDLEITSDSICFGDSTAISAKVRNGSSATIYSWESTLGFIANGTKIIVSPTTTTSYLLKVTDGSRSTKISIVIIVFPQAPRPTITTLDSMLMTEVASSYQWYLDGQVISGATNSSFKPLQNGNYQVKIVDDHGCFSELSEPIFFIITSAKDLLNVDCSISPNPTKDYININGTQFLTNSFSSEIFNSQGISILYSFNLSRIDVSTLPNGLYTIQLNINGHKSIKKLIILKYI